jgi:hypothetical protein
MCRFTSEAYGIGHIDDLGDTLRHMAFFRWAGKGFG